MYMMLIKVLIINLITSVWIHRSIIASTGAWASKSGFGHDPPLRIPGICSNLVSTLLRGRLACLRCNLRLLICLIGATKRRLYIRGNCRLRLGICWCWRERWIGLLWGGIIAFFRRWGLLLTRRYLHIIFQLGCFQLDHFVRLSLMMHWCLFFVFFLGWIGRCILVFYSRLLVIMNLFFMA
jgi:hypothetical protein